VLIDIQEALSKDIFNTYSQNEVLNLLSNAGFSDARIADKNGKPFSSHCALAIKA